MGFIRFSDLDTRERCVYLNIAKLCHYLMICCTVKALRHSQYFRVWKCFALNLEVAGSSNNNDSVIKIPAPGVCIQFCLKSHRGRIGLVFDAQDIVCRVPWLSQDDFCGWERTEQNLPLTTTKKGILIQYMENMQTLLVKLPHSDWKQISSFSHYFKHTKHT